LACVVGQPEAVKLILANEIVDPNAREEDQRTPLHLACSVGQPEIVKLLLANEKLDPNATAQWKEYLFDFGSRKESFKVVHRTPLHLACEKGQPDQL